MKPYRKHILICSGKTCTGKNAEGILKRLREKIDIDQLNDIKTSKGGCFGACKDSDEKGQLCPVAVIYPEGIWFKNLDEVNIDRVVDEYIKNGRIMEDLFLYKMQG